MMLTERSAAPPEPRTAPQVSWIAVNTHPSRESFALENLERQSFNAYCPRVRKFVGTRTGKKEVLRPLFSGYVFVEVPRESLSWYSIFSTYGVRKVVRFGNTVGFIDPTFIDSLKRREICGAIVKPLVPYAAGQNVQIIGGAFDSLIGRILAVEEKDRLLILMNLLGQSVHARISSDRVSRYQNV